MRNGFLGLTVVLAAATTGFAADDAKAILDKAAAAYGDKDDRAKYRGEKASYTGDLTLMGTTISVEGTNTTTAGKARMDLEMSVSGQKIKVKQVTDGTKTSVVATVGGTDMKPPVSDAEASELKLVAYLAEIMTIDPLKDEKRFAVKVLPDEEVEKKKADVLEVTVLPLSRTLKLYLDKETHLISMVSRQGLLPGNREGKQGQLATKLSEYKKVDGLMSPMRITSTVDGADFLTAKITDVTRLEKVDDKEFTIDD